ncbi:flagellar hook-length control protein FliK [Halomonas sp. SIMBA_159]
MNIQLLLSANPNQGSGASASQATGAQGLSNGLFRQAMLQANEGPPRLPQELSYSTAPVTQESAALNEFASLLESLGIELNQEALEALFAQLQTAEQPSLEQLATLPGVPDVTSESSLSALDEISSRLSLVAAFSELTAQPTSATAEITSIAAIAEQLAISQQDATALVAAYQQLASSTGATGSNQRLETLNQQIASLLASHSATNAPANGQPASGTLTTANLQTVHVSSEAMASALAVSGGTGEAAARLSSGSELAFNLPSASGTSQPIAASTGTSLPSSIGTPVSHPAWPSQLGQQLIQFAQKGGEQHIQMKLHPAELGPLSISLKMTEHGAQAHFLSAHAQVRQVIEQAIPQLREALAEQGISLGDTSVGEQNTSNEQAFAQQNTTPGSMGDDSGVDSEAGIPITESAPVAIDGRVDLYA